MRFALSSRLSSVHHKASSHLPVARVWTEMASKTLSACIDLAGVSFSPLVHNLYRFGL
jgi:hypothetical protein